MIQRWGRSSRLDPRNLAKHNHIFLWAEDRERCVNVLSLLKDSDPEFHKKLRVVGMEYAKQGSKEVIEGMREEEEKLQDWSRMACVSLDERRMHKLKELMEEADRLERVPKRNEKGGRFWGYMKEGKNKDLMHIALQNQYIRADYERYQREKEQRLSPREKLEELIDEANRLERVPKEKETGGQFWTDMKKGCNKDLLSIALQNKYLREDYERYRRKREERQSQIRLSPQEKLRELIEEANRLERVPSDKEKGGRFWEYMKQGHHKDLLLIALQNQYLRENYDKYQQRKQERLSPQEKLEGLIDEANRLERAPKQNERGGQFWTDMKKGCNKDLLSIALQNQYLRENHDKYQQRNQERLSPQENLRELIEEANRLERVPSDKEKGGQFWSNMKQGRHKDLLPIALQNQYLRENYDKYQQRKQERLSPQEKLRELIGEANRLERAPKQNEKGGNFWNNMKQGGYKYLLQVALQNPYLKASYDQFQSRTKGIRNLV
jgi:iron-sulfur cluster repair protein YtfE (RIC family)